MTTEEEPAGGQRAAAQLTVPEPLFRAADSLWAPSPVAAGPWRPGLLHGGAVAALLAHLAQRELGERPLTRISVDFLGPQPAQPLAAATRTVRAGRSFGLVDVLLTADGTDIARASALGVRDAATALPRLAQEPPMPHRTGGLLTHAPYGDEPSFNRDAVEVVVVDDPANPHGGSAWARLRTGVAGAAAPPWLAAVALADLTHGIGAVLPPDRYHCVNLDLTVHLVRPPTGEWIALRARTRPGPGGTGVAETVLMDDAGAFGTAAQTLLITADLADHRGVG
ncbi:thioesterase family protein [Streptomyces sp. NBC_00878]|uniref:thioesterase family protein n=1 Tax=Streptomyces sp. NBC_00878 TaxID=2975854 RepID=UPI0022593DE5|nr:thioesterase family protein [Streptomyces sp. NBC_00878]MCX4904251.1 thioesterase family protein [Streptomyces sp. NBC_00878]